MSVVSHLELVHGAWKSEQRDANLARIDARVRGLRVENWTV